MTDAATRNGSKPETGERGFSSEADDLFVSGHFPYEVDEPKPKDYEEMFGEDTQAEALLRGVTLPITGATYEIEDAEGGAKEGEFVREVLLKPTHEGGMTTPMSSVLAQMCAGFAHPLVFFEKVFPDPKETDGKYVYKKIALRPAETCKIKRDKHGGFDGFVQEGYKDGRPVEEPFGIDKAFVYVHRGGEKPLKGRSSFKAVYKKYKHKKRVEWLFFDNLQTFTRGIRKATYGGDGGAEGAKALFERVKKVEGAGTLVIGKDDDLEVMRAPGVSAEYKEALNYLDSQMARALLAQWLNLGQDGKTGTYALSRDHSDFFLQSMESVLDEIAWHINNFLIPPLIKYNFGLAGKAPKWVFQPLSENAKKEALEIGRELIAKGQLKPKPGLLKGIEEKMAQALEIDAEKLEEDEEGEPEETPEAPRDDSPAPEGLQRAIDALRMLPGSGGSGVNENGPALEENEGEWITLYDEDGSPVELHLPGKHVQRTHGRTARFAARGFEDASETDRKRLGIPPAWTDVQVDRSPAAALLAVGLDKKGREQRIYSAAHHENQAAAKFARIGELHERLPRIDERIARDAKTDDTALAALMIRRMGLRPGSDTDTGAEKKAHGATNLKASHIETSGDTVRANFTGKKGVDLDLSLEDPELARLLRERKQGKGGGDRLLDTDERKLRGYMARVAPGVKPKDLRTYLGTATAMRLVEEMRVPKNKREYQSRRREVGKQVSDLLGNTPTVALASYIAPSVFGSWDSALAGK